MIFAHSKWMNIEVAISSITAGGDQSGCITTTGKFLRWGVRGTFEESVWNPSEELALKDKYKFVEVQLGEEHAVGQLDNGKLITWGGNSNGALGAPNVPIGSYRTIPHELFNKEGVISFSCNSWSNAAVVKGGKVFYWGKNWAPTPKQKYFDKPQKIQTSIKATKVAVGDAFMVIIGEDGEIYSAGDGSGGKLGVDLVESQEFVKITGFPGEISPKPVKEKKKFGFKSKSVETPELWKSLKVGKTYSVAMNFNSQIFVWGSTSTTENTKKIETVIKKPLLLTQLQKIEIEDVTVGDDDIAVSIGLESLPSIQFISFNPPLIKCGTLEGLTDYLFQPKRPEEYLNTYLLCYNQWTNGLKFLEYLQAQFEESGQSQATQWRILLVVEKWLKTRSNVYDPFEDRALWHAMESFVRSLSGPTSSIKPKLHKLLIEEMKISDFRFPSPVNPESLLQNIFNSPPRVVAEQLMLVDHFYLSTISPNELVGQKWSKDKKEKEAPNVINVISRFNNFSSWCISSIIVGDNNNERNVKFNKWIDIMSESLKIRNYNTAQWIYSAVESVSLHKLIKSEILSFKGKNAEVVKEVSEFLFAGNSIQLRKSLQEAINTSQAAIPYLGSYLKDLTFLEDGLPSKLENELINFEKWSKVSNFINSVVKMQQVEPPYQKKEQIYNDLFYVKGSDEKKLDMLVKQVMEGGNVVKQSVLMENDSLNSTGTTVHRTTAVNLGASPNTEAFALQIETQSKQIQSRKQIWGEWSKCLKENLRNIETKSQGFFVSYKEAFNCTNAIEETLLGVVNNWPNKSDLIQLEKLIELSFGQNISQENIPVLIEILKEVNSLTDLSNESKISFCKFLSSFRDFSDFKLESKSIEGKVFIESENNDYNYDNVTMNLEVYEKRVENINYLLNYISNESQDKQEVFGQIFNYISQRKDKMSEEVLSLEKERLEIVSKRPSGKQSILEMENELKSLISKEEELLKELERIRNQKSIVQHTMNIAKSNLKGVLVTLEENLEKKKRLSNLNNETFSKLEKFSQQFSTNTERLNNSLRPNFALVVIESTIQLLNSIENEIKSVIEKANSNLQNPETLNIFKRRFDALQKQATSLSIDGVNLVAQNEKLAESFKTLRENILQLVFPSGN